MRNFRLKVGSIVVAVLAGASFFVWRDLSQGHYIRVVLMLLLSLAGALRSTKNFKRYRVGRR